MRRSLHALTPLLFLIGVEGFREQQKPVTTSPVVGVVGRWSEDLVDGAPTIRGEGATDAVADGQAHAVAASLFGETDPAFVANATAPSAFALAVLRDIPGLSAGRFEARFNLVSGASDQTAGLVFDLQPSGEYLFVRYNTREGNMALWRFAGGKRERIARTEQKVQLPLGAWHRITLDISGTRIVGEVNDALGLEHDLGRVPSGRVGFWTKRDSVTLFKQVIVRPAH